MNSKFVHMYAHHTRNINSIWSLTSMDGREVKDQDGIVKEAHSYFKYYYCAKGNFSILAATESGEGISSAFWLGGR